MLRSHSQDLTFAKVRSNDVDLGCLSPNHAYTGLLISVDSAKPRAKIAVS